ncbi:MAG: cyclic nucleotide-binding domain-containing protein [Deltaproteobacteria bacterium]|nr:cyclic nucleotide-binding domain-containing protein [Deltaproteobacteria bacterium]MBW2051600.1 cyclic nucleotide-binding domain-containing protein [Deltaproteobacteria bacterium]MBW2140159.1 cyclic nucleotide-binding domain-containing protein [Deltaproteobacteria bacterium]MBW2322922.1 cyclic nucleotide-binding domain-containing protein [Deltaproteobacteria bacterium]
MNEQQEILRRLDFFKSFSTEEIEKILESAEWVKASAGERIITEGEDDLYLYLLIKGQVSVVKNNKVLAVLSAGDTFGEIGALAGNPRTAHVVAKDQCFCLRVASHQIGEMEINLQLKFVKKILYTLASRLVDLDRRFAAM